MADRPIISDLPADLPTDWKLSQIVSPNGTEAGFSEKYGFNYLNGQVNAAQKAINTINAAFDGIPNSTAWHLIQEYTIAGTYTFEIPEGITELGFCMIGGGGSGAVGKSAYRYTSASGGGSGVTKSFILDVAELIKLNIVVGKGGKNNESGGTTSVNGITTQGGTRGYSDGDDDLTVLITHGSDGGQASFLNWGAIKLGLAAGGNQQYIVDSDMLSSKATGVPGESLNTPAQSVNPFEPDISSPRKYLLSAGGFAGYNKKTLNAVPPNQMLPDIKGGDGKYYTGNEGSSFIGDDATGYGNGGGAIVVADAPSGATVRAGYGSDGAVFIYAR